MRKQILCAVPECFKDFFFFPQWHQLERWGSVVCAYADAHALFFYSIFLFTQMSTQQGPDGLDVLYTGELYTHKHRQSSMAMFFSLSEGRLTLLIRAPSASPPLA